MPVPSRNGNKHPQPNTESKKVSPKRTQMMAYSELIRPLKYVENQFLQVLLTRFSLKPDGAGGELRRECGDATPTISTRLGKSRIRKGISDFEKKSDDYQKLFDSILIRGTKKTPLKYHDKGFPFRYASGGTLDRKSVV